MRGYMEAVYRIAFFLSVNRTGNLVEIVIYKCFVLNFLHIEQSKTAKELYALINYGELRKKIKGAIDARTGQKLNELVKKGYV